MAVLGTTATTAAGFHGAWVITLVGGLVGLQREVAHVLLGESGLARRRGRRRTNRPRVHPGHLGGRAAPPPITQLLDTGIEEVEERRAVFALTPAEWMFSPIGSVHGGIAATILDSCMGCAIHTTLPARTGYTTGDLQVRYLRAMSAGTGRVLPEGTVVDSGRRQATAEGRLYVDETGKVIATATTGCIVLGV